MNSLIPSKRPDYLRLRQICLVARDALRAETLLTRILGLDVAYRDERVSRYGLQNFLLPLGTSFIEVVIPIEPETAAGRFLDKHQERHGYMAIFDCSDLASARARIDRLGIRVLHSRKWPRYENVQLHPRDTGATLFEFHHNIGGDDPMGYYEPAGEHWQPHIRDDVSVALFAVEFLARDPLALAQRWVGLFDKPIRRSPEGHVEIPLDNVLLRFLPGDSEGHLDALCISVRDVEAVVNHAKTLGCPVDGHSIELCGIWFRLRPA
jgi:catechol 2,3-dioxygenase-like lactoylglutathione lyase family enzyme